MSAAAAVVGGQARSAFHRHNCPQHGKQRCGAWLEAALWCLHQTVCFEAAVLAATNGGDDADTAAAAITGQLAAAHYGVALRDFGRVNAVADADADADVNQYWAV